MKIESPTASLVSSATPGLKLVIWNSGVRSFVRSSVSQSTPQLPESEPGTKSTTTSDIFVAVLSKLTEVSSVVAVTATPGFAAKSSKEIENPTTPSVSPACIM